MKLQIFKLEELRPAEYNPRVITAKALQGLQESIEKFGYLQPIIVNIHGGKEPTIVGGHQRLKAMQTQGVKKAKCVVVDFDPVTEKAANVALNSESISGDWDVEGLGKILEELKFEFPEFDEINLKELGESLKIDMESWGANAYADKDPDETPEVPEKVVIKTGDLIELGAHKLLCGDSTSEEDVKKLMGKEKADMVFTDPPYGIDVVKSNKVGGDGDTANGGYAFGGVQNTGKIGGENIRPSKTYKKIEGDQTTEIAEKFYQCCLDLGFQDIVLWGGNYFTDFLPPSRCWIVWDKEMTGNFSEAEMAWTSFEKGGVRLFKFLWNGLSREENRKEELISRVHPTQKPVGLFSNIFEKFEDLKTIYDGFLGSGTTLIACEKTGRRCFAMEIDPQYCQVTIQRWCDFTEQDEIRINRKKVSWRKYKS